MQCLIRHLKCDIKDIPRPIYRYSYLKLSETERSAYNAVVALVQSNLVTTEKDYFKTFGTHQDSLLNMKNKCFLSLMLLNIRIAASGGGRAKFILPAYGQRAANCAQLVRKFHRSTMISGSTIENSYVSEVAADNQTQDGLVNDITLMRKVPCRLHNARQAYFIVHIKLTFRLLSLRSILMTRCQE